jgi:hypothetical protein
LVGACIANITASAPPPPISDKSGAAAVMMAMAMTQAVHYIDLAQSFASCLEVLLGLTANL